MFGQHVQHRVVEGRVDPAHARAADLQRAPVGAVAPAHLERAIGDGGPRGAVANRQRAAQATVEAEAAQAHVVADFDRHLGVHLQAAAGLGFFARVEHHHVG